MGWSSFNEDMIDRYYEGLQGSIHRIIVAKTDNDTEEINRLSKKCFDMICAQREEIRVVVRLMKQPKFTLVRHSLSLQDKCNISEKEILLLKADLKRKEATVRDLVKQNQDLRNSHQFDKTDSKILTPSNLPSSNKCDNTSGRIAELEHQIEQLIVRNECLMDCVRDGASCEEMMARLSEIGN